MHAVELAAAIKEQPQDSSEFRTALSENVVIIAKLRARVEALHKELARMRGTRHELDEYMDVEEGHLAAVRLPAAQEPAPASAPAPAHQQQAHAGPAAAEGHQSLGPGGAASGGQGHPGQQQQIQETGGEGQGVWL
jgi:hypothetical protein